MKTAELKRIVCAGCAQSYRWKPELAGKKAKCKCGKTIVFFRRPIPMPWPRLPPRPQWNRAKWICAPSPKRLQNQCPPSPMASAPNAGPLSYRRPSFARPCGMNLRTGKRLGTAVAVENPAGQPRGGFAKSSNVSPEGTKAKTMTPKLWLMIGVVIALGAAAAARISTCKIIDNLAAAFGRF